MTLTKEELETLRERWKWLMGGTQIIAFGLSHRFADHARADIPKLLAHIAELEREIRQLGRPTTCETHGKEFSCSSCERIPR